MKKILYIIPVLTLLLFACAAKTVKLGSPKYPSMDQALISISLDLKEKLPKGSTLVIITDQKRPAVKELAEKFAVKVVEIGAPKISVVERKNIDKALEELNLQNSDTFDEEKTVSIGKFVGAKCALLVIIKPEKRYRRNLYNEELDRTQPHIKVIIRVKGIEIETTKLIWAKETHFWYPLPSKKMRSLRKRTRRPMR